MQNKSYMVIGLGKSGIALANYIYDHGAPVTAYDKKPSEDALKQLNSHITVLSGEFENNWLIGIDELVMSPGVPTKLDFITKARESGISVIGEIEFAYRLCPGKIIAITGTNGKTTTTTLVGEMLKNAYLETFVVGNIGNVFVGEVDKMTKESAVVAEISSYQLETVIDFEPEIAAVLNVTPDHLSRHGTIEAYTEAKRAVFGKMHGKYVVLNKDNPATAEMSVNDNIPVYFSTREILARGAWLENDTLTININGTNEKLCKVSELNILGTHNIENALAASLLARLYGASAESISKTLKGFMGVEHRIEYCGTANGIRFYNDSKGTNCDSTIKAIESMPSNTSLILGGFDKGGSFDELFDVIIASGKIKFISVIGETTQLILHTAEKYGYKNIVAVKTLDEATNEAYKACTQGENVLLSPACASWDMFDNFEQRGVIFKKIASRIIENESYILM